MNKGKRIHLGLIAALVIGLASCGEQATRQYSSSSYHVAKDLMEVAESASLLFEAEILRAPELVAIQMPEVDPGERSAQSLWAYEVSEVRVTRLISSGRVAGGPQVGSRYLVAVTVVNPAVGRTVFSSEPSLESDFPKSGETLAQQIGERVLVMTTTQRMLGDEKHWGFEALALLGRGGQLSGVVGPLRGKAVSQSDFVAAFERAA